MAGADYVKCIECGQRLFYDGERIIRDEMEEDNYGGVACERCVKKLKKKIERLKKFDRRKH